MIHWWGPPRGQDLVVETGAGLRTPDGGIFVDVSWRDRVNSGSGVAIINVGNGIALERSLTPEEVNRLIVAAKQFAISLLRMGSGAAGRLAAHLPPNTRDGLGKLILASRPRRFRLLRRLYAPAAFEFVRSLYLTDRRPPLMVEVPLTVGTRLKVDLRTKSGRHMAFDHEYEPDVVQLMERLYEPGEVALDIGANLGFFSAYLGRRAAGAGGKVLAFEPFEGNYQLLTENIVLNDLTPTVMACQVALADQEGRSTYYINPLNDGGGGLQRMRSGVSDGRRWYSSEQLGRMGFTDLETSTDTVRLDMWLQRPDVGTFIGKNRRISLIKCDVEGGELGVLQGGRSLLEGDRDGSHPAWIVEVSNQVADVFQIFKRAGYVAFESSLNGPRPVDATTVNPGANALFVHRDDERLTTVGMDRHATISVR